MTRPGFKEEYTTTFECGCQHISEYITHGMVRVGDSLIPDVTHRTYVKRNCKDTTHVDVDALLKNLFSK